MPAALSAYAVYPVIRQNAVGLAANFDAATWLMGDEIAFNFDGTQEEYSDFNNVPDTLVLSGPKCDIDASVRVIDRDQDNAQKPYGHSWTLAQLGLNVPKFFHGWPLTSGYVINMPFGRTTRKAGIDETRLKLRLFGVKPAITFPA